MKGKGSKRKGRERGDERLYEEEKGRRKECMMEGRREQEDGRRKKVEIKDRPDTDIYHTIGE